MSDFSCFDSPDALWINQARWDHFLSLGIPLKGKIVLEVGCGVGHFTKRLLDQGAEVLPIDAKPYNIAECRKRLNSVRPQCADIEDLDDLRFTLRPICNGVVDLIFAYGLLYHLPNPVLALANMRILLAANGVLALETIVLDSLDPICLLVLEDSQGQNQGIHEVSTRCSSSFLQMALSGVGFGCALWPEPQPDHPDFKWQPRNSREWRRDGHLLRRVLIA